MNKDWFTLIKEYTIPGARDKFETICGTLFKKIHPKQNARVVKVKQGDGGIDIFIGKIGLEPINVVQCKFFPNEFGDSQKKQIRESFKTAIESKEYKMYKWTLCVICTLDLKENKWWVNWKDKMSKLHNLTNNFINLIDGDDLIDLLYQYNLYNQAFEREDSIKIHEIHQSIAPKLSLNQIEKGIQKASLFLCNVKNYFEKQPSTHIERKETNSIINWVKTEIKLPQKNILILEGDKGFGKSVILKDVYEKLNNQGYLVLGIKADKYYASNPKELENKLFINENISFSRILEAINNDDKQLIVIIDQLDALSQTLSSNREYIQTYNRIINELVGEKNIRIIISSRTYDLKYDADLSIYKSNEYQNIKTALLNENEVKDTLKQFNVNCSIKKVIELLRTPNHLEIFCKLPNKNKINLNTLSSLKDLYDVLWDTLIINQKGIQLNQVLYCIAEEMYNKQQIEINKNIVSKFNSELNYLYSNQLLIIQNSDIQFFHQTFYDYCFARQFVENGNNIFNYLNQNQQNLEIRSIIKMVFEYLREYNHEKYIKYTKSILKSSKYRFHIKSLIINNLGTVTPTKEEKELLKSHILKNKDYEDVFIHSVYSIKWIEYLINTGLPAQYLFVHKKPLNYLYDYYNKQSFFHSLFLENLNFKAITEHRKNAIWVLLRNNINNAPYKITSHLDGLPKFPDKERFIEKVLFNLDNWKDKRMLEYFQKFLPFDDKSKGRDNFWFYEISRKIFDHHPDYIFQKTKPILINRFNNSDSWYSIDFSHDQTNLLNTMYSKSPENSFLFILSLYKTVIESNKSTSIDYTESPYYGCNKFYDGINTSKEGHIFIQEFLLSHLINKKEDKEYILSFYENHKNSNSIHLLRLIVLFFKEERVNYINEIFELIKIIHSKNGLNSKDDYFQLFLRQLIGDSFILFSEVQKEKLTEILLSITYPYDLEGRKYEDANGNKKVYFTGYGTKLYLFLCLLPKNEINNNPKLKKIFQELKRKFGEVDANKARDVSSGGSYVVGTPLGQSAYRYMDMISWKRSILKFDDNYVERHGPRGGKLEHSRAFRDSVKENPERFYDFIVELFEDKNVSISYISSGIDGLIDGKYTPEKVKKLFKKLINLNLDNSNTLYTIWKTDYLIKHKLIDKEIVLFLSECALNHPNPEKALNEDDALNDSLNSVRGSAIHKIIKCYEFKEFSNLIFDTINKAVYDPQTSVKVAIITELAFLNHLDINKAFSIFLKLIEQDNIQILRNSIRASQYFNNKFHDKMLSYFNKIISNKELHPNGQVIILSWLIEEINDKRLYERFIKSSKDAKLCALKVSEANLINNKEEVSNKCLDILKRFLNEKDKEFVSAYSGIVLRKIKSHNFIQFYSFLQKYSRTSLCMGEPRYFLLLLLSCAKDYPKECLNLIENMNFSKVPNIQESGYYREEPVQLILAIYSKLNMDLKNNKKYVEKSLNIFDSMLTQSHLRASANKAIELTL